MRNIRKDENGYIVVETVGSFMLFTLLVVSILTMINIVTVQARIHYAITQTANELAMYSYAAHASEIPGSELMGNLETVTESLYNLSDAVGAPIEILEGGLGSAAYTLLARNILRRHLENDGTDADTNLESRNIIGGFNGIRLYDSKFPDGDDDNITVVADYRINFAYGLGALPIPEQFRSLPVSQTAMTRAWRGGIPYE